MTNSNKTGWNQFWKTEKRSFYEVMKLATGYFADQLVRRYELNSTHSILDYGCGPGFLLDYLDQKNLSITGADINEYFIEEGRTRHPGAVFIHISTDIESNKKILAEKLQPEQFDLIIMLSISQYLKDTEELEGIVRLLTPYVENKGKIIIADVVDEGTASYRDALALMLQCIRSGKIISFFRFMIFVTSSSYAKISKEVSLLFVSEDAINKIADRNSLGCEKVSGLTLHPSRKNYILTKK